jgi:hypothetical protein
MNIRGAGVPCVISGSGGGGSAQINWEGAWDPATAYQIDDIVEYNGSSYIAIQGSTNETPAVPSAYWDLVAAKGDTGSQGPPGAPGADGDGTAYYGQMYNQSAQTVSISTAGTYVEMNITGTFDTANSYGLIAPSTASFGIKNDSGATQLLHFIATADVGTSNNAVVGLRLALNGVPLSETTCQAPTGAGGNNFAKAMTQWMIELDDGDEVSMWLTNVTAANTLTVNRAKIVAITPGRQGEQGTAGTAATIAVGTVTTGAPGSPAAVTNSGTSSAAVFDFDIPEGDKGDKGDQGDPGAAATIAVGTVTTGAPGSSATVTNSGTSSAAVFDFSIPEGDKGDKGDKGDQGDTGTGSWAHPTVVTANTGTGNAEYTLPGAGEEMVWKGGAIQIRGTDYTRAGNDITFAVGNVPAAGEDVTVAVAQNNLTSTDALTLNGVGEDVDATASTIVKRGTDSTIKASNHASIGSAGADGTAVILDSNGKIPAAALPSNVGNGFAMALIFGGC